MRTVLFFFSGTGNTWWVCSRLKEELEALGNSAEMYSIEDPALEEEGFISGKVKRADRIIVGYPVYGSDMPDNIRNLIRTLPVVSDGKKFGAFCTQAAFSGDGSVFLKKDIQNKGYNFSHAFRINMTTNFNVAVVPFLFFKPAGGKKLEKIKAKASTKIKRMAEKIDKGREYLEGRRIYQTLPGSIQRSLFRRSRQKLTGLFKFDRDRCVKCRLCAETCPTGNIIFDPEKTELKRGEKCILCFRCYNFCPSLAINYGSSVRGSLKCKRYKGPAESFTLEQLRGGKL